MYLHLPDWLLRARLAASFDFLCFYTKKVLIGDTKDVVVVNASFHADEQHLGSALGGLDDGLAEMHLRLTVVDFVAPR